MTDAFAALAANPKVSHAEALQKSMSAMISDSQHSECADCKFWALFVVVGEPAKAIIDRFGAIGVPTNALARMTSQHVYIHFAG
jgi:hypothetical protein